MDPGFGVGGPAAVSHTDTIATTLSVRKGVAVAKDQIPDVYEVDPAKLRKIKEMRAGLERMQKTIAAKAPHRPRPWHTQARPEQLPPPGDWSTWVVLAGRGYGKTKLSAEWIAEQAARNPGTEWAIVAPTWRDCQKTCIEGSSGLLNAFLPGELEGMNVSNLQVRLTNGSRIYGYSADRPDRLRGSNLSGAWVDEAAAMPLVDQLFEEALLPALRIGQNPRVLISTTPRPISFLRKLLSVDDGSVAVVRGSTWDNAANLSKSALARLRVQYEGTRRGLQELEGLILDDVEGALWTRDGIDATRVLQAPTMSRIVVGLDPAVTSGEKSDFTGIVVCGIGSNGHLYVLEDCTLKGSPHACMSKAVDAYHRWHADRIVGEVNNGGDYLETVLRTVDPNVAYKTVRATRGKVKRAEPIAALWEQGRGHLVGVMSDLEDELCAHTPDAVSDPKSDMHDDRLDAMVWAATELQVGASAMVFLSAISKMCPKCDMPNKKVSTVCRGCGTQLPEAA